MNLEKQHKLECSQARCQYFNRQCQTYWGKECKEIGGERIPRIAPGQYARPREVVGMTRFKPYFMSASNGA